MAVLSKDEYFARLHSRLAEDTSDEGISFLEDMTDTYNDMESRANGDGVNWEQRYKDLDESWKKRYSHRFFSGGGGNIPDCGSPSAEADEYTPESITVESLFTKKEET